MLDRSERDECLMREMCALMCGEEMEEKNEKNRLSFIILIGSGIKFFFILDECYSAHL